MAECRLAPKRRSLPRRTSSRRLAIRAVPLPLEDRQDRADSAEPARAKGPAEVDKPAPPRTRPATHNLGDREPMVRAGCDELARAGVSPSPRSAAFAPHASVSVGHRSRPATDEVRMREGRRGRLLVTIASGPPSGGRLGRAARAVAALPLTPFRVGQRRRPAVADIIDASLIRISASPLRSGSMFAPAAAKWRDADLGAQPMDF